MKPPRKAFILAAGLGTRLRPLTFHTPKPLVPVWGKPALLLTLRRLKSWGVQEVVINVHSHLDQFHRFVQDARCLNIRIELSYEPIVLDTGGALRRAAWFFDNEPFWLVNGDIVFDVNPSPFLSAFSRHRPPLAALWCTDQQGPRTVEISKGLVTCFRSKTPGTPGTYTFCGLHLLSPRILSFIPTPEPYSIIAAYNNAMKAGERIHGISVLRHYWADLGTVDSYLTAHRDLAEAYKNDGAGGDLVDPATWRHSQALRKKGVSVNGMVAVHPDASIAQGASLSNTIAWSGSRMTSNARSANAVIADSTLAGPHLASGAILPLTQTPCPPSLKHAITSLGFSDESTVIPFSPRGSARTFSRLQNGRKSAILIRYDLSRPENALHAGHTRFLTSAGISVPHLLADNPTDQWCLMEDCGDTSLLELVNGTAPTSLRRHYTHVIDGVVDMHSQRLIAQLRRRHIQLALEFSPALYRWEHDLFVQHFVTPRLANDRKTPQAIRRELGRVAVQLEKQPQVLLHRDLQSSNILFRNGAPVFIDYQGMRLGPAMYDVASLLADPYVSLSPTLQDHLLACYADRTNRPIHNLTPIFWLAAVQRLCQALGAYGRLTGLGLESFRAHIRPALIMLDRALVQTDNEPVLRSFVQSVLESGA